jgi:hypothetical protein
MALSGGIVVGSNKCYNKSQIHLKHSSRVVFLLRCKNSILQHNVPISGYAMLVEASPAVSDFIMDGYFARAVPKVLLRRSISEYKCYKRRLGDQRSREVAPEALVPSQGSL